MSDLIERLRGPIGPLTYQHNNGIDLTLDAASEIERLTAIESIEKGTAKALLDALKEVETLTAKVSRLETVYKAAESVTETWYEGKALLESIHGLSAALSDAASGRRDTIPQQGACEQPENRTTLPADSRQPREWEVLVDEHGWILTIRQDGEGDRGWIRVREVPVDSRQTEK